MAKKRRVKYESPKGKRIPGQMGQALKMMLLFLSSK